MKRFSREQRILVELQSMRFIGMTRLNSIFIQYTMNEKLMALGLGA